MLPYQIYRRTAQGHLLAAEILAKYQRKPDGSRSPIFFAYYNNLGLSIELYLKSYLNYAGIKEAKLQNRPFGHDIPYMYHLCVDLFELKFRPADMRKIVDLIGQTYADHGYRYQKDGTQAGCINEGPATLETMQVLRGLDGHLEGITG